MTISVMKLCTMTEAELGKMTKGELIASIKHESWMPNHYKSEAEQARKTLEDNATDERSACIVLAALVGETIERNEHSGKLNTKPLNILELAGKAAAMCVRVAK